ncbi:MAG: 3-oxoacyl-[acyl-carrier-protein] reductase [Abiotrophia defectiva]|uniref:3-oxoacyl-[acyl-carrier-protein] reductase n=1 Tax=Abiotrophia defectiva TaxID=46125 RepID=A0A929MPC5_ABIDE|nr:3-oxoacyl-[acyl-carrier-protein] reductase [Abiotrophia defectiva]
MTLTCLITGSSRGIGLAIAHHLAAKGHRVILNSRSPIAPEVLAQFDGYEQPVLQATGDISQFDVAKQLVDDLYDQGVQVDVLVNNAGITRDGLVMRMSEEDFNAVIQTNLNGCFNMCRHLTPRLLKQKGGRIINMTSVVGVMANAGQVNYAASKAGMIGLTKSLAREVASRGITVNAIAPGFIETDMTDQLSDRVKEAMLGQIPLKRFGQVEHIAQTVDFLIDNDYITGQVIEVNGGLHI